jgi:hypothetical protein
MLKFFNGFEPKANLDFSLNTCKLTFFHSFHLLVGEQLFLVILDLLLCCCKMYPQEYNQGFWCSEVVSFGQTFWWHLTNNNRQSFVSIGEHDLLPLISQCIFSPFIPPPVWGHN